MEITCSVLRKTESTQANLLHYVQTSKLDSKTLTPKQNMRNSLFKRTTILESPCQQLFRLLVKLIDHNAVKNVRVSVVSSNTFVSSKIFKYFYFNLNFENKPVFQKVKYCLFCSY